MSAAWDGAERHAAALEAYARQEPSPWTDFVVARGRCLAARGRGEAGPALVAELVRLKEKGEGLGHYDALPAIDAALTALPVPAESKQKRPRSKSLQHLPPNSPDE